jgi:superfamily II DNA/RNA helicase
VSLVGDDLQRILLSTLDTASSGWQITALSLRFDPCVDGLLGGLQIMVFFSSCASVKYHAELLNFIDLPVKDIHGKQKQQRRTTTFMDFCKVGPVVPAGYVGMVQSATVKLHTMFG